MTKIISMEEVERRIAEGFAAAAEVHKEQLKHAGGHKDGAHLDMSYLADDDESHLDVED